MRLRAAFLAAALACSPAAAEDAALRDKIENLFERGSDEHRFHMMCLNGDRRTREAVHKFWLADIKDSIEALAKHVDTFDSTYLNTLRFETIENAKPDDDTTLSEQRTQCDADKDWLQRLKFMHTVVLSAETTKILDGD